MWEAGQVIKDRYQLRDQLGHNTGRQTWLAQDLASETSELVIVKLLTFGGNIQWDDVRLFEREAQILQQLNHDRIPKYKNYFSIDDNTLWFALVEEYITGNSLKQLLEQGMRFGEAEIINLAQDILQILVYLHSFNPPILHRDIKPSNLLMGDDHKIYLVDFGAVQDNFASEGTTFTIVGTYGYAPLEQFGGKTVPASDLYALGISLIHLLTRTAPSNLPTKDLKVQFRDLEEIRSAGHVVPGLPARVTISPKLANWLEKMIAPAVERRFQTAINALKHLPDIAEDSSEINTQDSDFKLDEITNDDPTNKPIESNVKIVKQPDAIEIVIPGQGLTMFSRLVSNLAAKFNQFMSLFIVSGVMMVLLTKGRIILLLRLLFSPLIFLALLLLWLVDADFRNLFITTRIKCDRQNFAIVNSFLGFTKIYRGSTSAIKDISIHYVPQNKKRQNLKIDSLIIHTKSTADSSDNNTYLIGQNLSEAELLWLVQELRDWLNNNQKLRDRGNDWSQKLDSSEP